MKTLFNPTASMLTTYINIMGNDYEDSFIKTNLEDKKLYAFCKSLVNMLNQKVMLFDLIINEDKSINISCSDNVMIKYTTDVLKSVKNENSLKFKFLVEWGFLLECLDKELINVAI